jgi:hypothetical protein
MNTANLLKLAEYLEALPADYRHFDMELFIKSGTEFRPTYPAKAEETIKHCGTAACAIGHGPSAGILPPSIPAMNNWGVYCEEAFGMNFMDNEGQWCFGSNWCEHDNTPAGAAARIRYLLAGKPIPLDYDEPQKDDDYKHAMCCYEPFLATRREPQKA